MTAGAIELPPVILKPRKSNRSNKWEPREDGKSRCPYCLETLEAVEAEPTPVKACPICQHGIPITILGTAPHCFNRQQKWDLLANEMAYIWDWEYCLLQGYRELIGSFQNEAYSEAKEDLVRLLQDKGAVLRLREEFLESQGELDCVIATYLENYRKGLSVLAENLLRGRKWRRRAMGLSAQGASPKQIAEFQLDFVKGLSWGVFGSMDRKQRALLFLEGRLEKLQGETP